jgi:hypothetical protein
LKRDRIDRRRPERTFLSFVASLLLHALGAPTETFMSGAIVTVTRQVQQTAAPAPAVTAQVPVPHAPVVPNRPVAARPQSAAPHPRVLHELAKENPSAPPNPTAAPVSTAPPIPAVTQAPQIAVTSAPIAAAVPTSVPVAVNAVSVKAPPTATPRPRPTMIPTAAPTKQPMPSKPTAAPTITPTATPVPQPSALAASAAPVVAMATPQAIVTPGSQAPIHVAASKQTGAAPTPGPKASGSPGPKGVAAVKSPKIARPIQPLPATPRPAAPAAPAKAGSSLLNRLKSLIPTAKPSVSPEPSKHYNFVGSLKVTQPEPTPPAEVLAQTKFIYVENEAGQRWKQSYLGTSPEERYVKMYVTKVKRIGFINWCTGWLVRAPMAGNTQWEVESNTSYICSGHLEPYTRDTTPAPSPSP